MENQEKTSIRRSPNGEKDSTNPEETVQEPATLWKESETKSYPLIPFSRVCAYCDHCKRWNDAVRFIHAQPHCVFCRKFIYLGPKPGDWNYKGERYPWKGGRGEQIPEPS